MNNPVRGNSATIKPSVQMMRDIQLFKAFTDKEVNTLINAGATLFYEAETNIVIEGELTWGLYVIMEGSVSILKTNKLNGTLFEVGKLSNGNFFGEMSFIDEDPRSATVKTLVDSQIFYLSKEFFTEFIEKSTDIKIRFLTNSNKALIRRLRELDDNYVISQYQLWQSVLKREVKGT
jgi:CRP/FNR family cyclic AMP-dependent transcriptional regulator